MPHVTFIHGISNKPVPDLLLESWRRALAKNDGIDLGAEGISSSMVYWADVMYPEPKAETDVHESAEDGVADTDDEAVAMEFRAEASGAEEEWMEGFASRLHIDAAVADDEAPPMDEAGAEFERIPLPGWMKKRIMSAFLRDVHHYLWAVTYSPRPDVEYEVQSEIRSRVQTDLQAAAAGGPPHVVVAHSMGTVIAYDNLARVADAPTVDGLITVGSPLGLDEIQDRFKPEWSRDEGFPAKVSGRWVNVFDRLDPVAGLDPAFSDDYRRNGEKTAVDIDEPNWGAWRHSVTKYLAGERFREELGTMLEL